MFDQANGFGCIISDTGGGDLFAHFSENRAEGINRRRKASAFRVPARPASTRAGTEHPPL
jgi:CspA family cold shock protein